MRNLRVEAEGEQELVADAGAGTAHGTAAKADGMNLKLGWIMDDGEWLMKNGWLNNIWRATLQCSRRFN